MTSEAGLGMVEVVWEAASIILCLAFGYSCAAVHAFNLDTSYLLDPATANFASKQYLAIAAYSGH